MLVNRVSAPYLITGRINVMYGRFFNFLDNYPCNIIYIHNFMYITQKLKIIFNKTVILEIHFFVVIKIIFIDNNVNGMDNFVNFFIIKVTILCKLIFKFFVL